MDRRPELEHRPTEGGTGAKEFADYAFQGCKALDQVEIKPGCKSIGRSAY